MVLQLNKEQAKKLDANLLIEKSFKDITNYQPFFEVIDNILAMYKKGLELDDLNGVLNYAKIGNGPSSLSSISTISNNLHYMQYVYYNVKTNKVIVSSTTRVIYDEGHHLILLAEFNFRLDLVVNGVNKHLVNYLKGDESLDKVHKAFFSSVKRRYHNLFKEKIVGKGMNVSVGFDDLDAGDITIDELNPYQKYLCCLNNNISFCDVMAEDPAYKTEFISHLEQETDPRVKYYILENLYEYDQKINNSNQLSPELEAHVVDFLHYTFGTGNVILREKPASLPIENVQPYKEFMSHYLDDLVPNGDVIKFLYDHNFSDTEIVMYCHGYTEGTKNDPITPENEVIAEFLLAYYDGDSHDEAYLPKIVKSFGFNGVLYYTRNAKLLKNNMDIKYLFTEAELNEILKLGPIHSTDKDWSENTYFYRATDKLAYLLGKNKTPVYFDSQETIDKLFEMCDAGIKTEAIAKKLIDANLADDNIRPKIVNFPDFKEKLEQRYAAGDFHLVSELNGSTEFLKAELEQDMFSRKTIVPY